MVQIPSLSTTAPPSFPLAQSIDFTNATATLLIGSTVHSTEEKASVVRLDGVYEDSHFRGEASFQAHASGLEEHLSLNTPDSTPIPPPASQITAHSIISKNCETDQPPLVMVE